MIHLDGNSSDNDKQFDLNYSCISGHKMKQELNILFFIYLSINCYNVDCQQSNSSMATNQLSLIDDDQCTGIVWHFFNTTSQLCECYNNPSTSDIVKCTEQGIYLRVGYCMTFEEMERTIYIAPCTFSGNFSTTGNGRYVGLPVKNASELNTHMCGPMNRRGRLCSECIEGFGPSIISSGLVCSKCTGIWYGVPLYLFLEFIPITLFFVVILFFRVNITSAPMVAFVFFSHIIVAAFLTYGAVLRFEHPTAYYLVSGVVTLYGFWNLDFFRYILPPLCVSPDLKHIHIILMDYVSAFYPLCLICFTWIVIKLHFHNFKPVVWLWSKLSKCSCIRDHSVSQTNSLIDVFTAFFLLSYSKLVYTSIRILSPLNALVYRNNTLSNTYQLAEVDASIEYFGVEHALYALISIFIVLLVILPPVLLLILYPIKVFRLLLFKCHLSTRTIAALNIFVEKYYSCYRDGTDGGKDMRSLASVYFILRWMASFIFVVTSLSTSLVFLCILYVSYGIVIALVRPYKKTYMNVIDTLIMENLALLALMADKYFFEDSNISLTLLYVMAISVFTFVPILGLAVFIAYRILKRIRSKLDLCRIIKKHTVNSNEPTVAIAQQDLQDDDSDPELPDRMLHPQQYTVEMNSFENVNYVRA